MGKGKLFIFIAGVAVGATAIRYLQTENGQKIKHYVKERTSEGIDALEESLIKQKEAKEETLREAERKAGATVKEG